MERIPVAGPWITEKEVQYVTDAARTAWYADHYKYNARFEQAFAEYVGRAHAITLPSCTSGLHLALLAAGVGPGDEVVVPDATWIASAAPITYVGATPVFADIDTESWCISADSFAAAVTPRTKAVIPVDLYGNMPDMDAILAAAEEHGVAVIEDAAQAHGSEYKGSKAGSFGRASVFSFHGSKTLTTGEGGMLVVDDEEVWQRCLFLRDHGREPGDRLFCNTEVAYKYKMSSLQAALGLAQLERIEELVARKREVFGWYAEELGDSLGATLNSEAPEVKSTYWMVTVVLDEPVGLRSSELMLALSEHGIDTRPFFHPLSSLPAYTHLGVAEQCRKRNPNAYRISARGVNLPSGFNLTREKVAYVCGQLKGILGRL